MSSDLILSIDQGTTGTTVSVYGPQGNRLDSADEDFKQSFPKPGWVEHDANVIWSSVLSGIHKLGKTWNLKKVLALGITNQRETVLFWDAKTGEPLTTAIVWQCRRTSERCHSLKRLESKIQKITGLLVDPYFSGTKIEWLLKNTPGLRKKALSGEAKCGTIDSYLLWRLSGGALHATDVTNASRTMLMDLKTQDWSEEMLSLFGVPKNCLPRILPSSGKIARTIAVSELPQGIPISGMAGDQQSALFGQGAFGPGESKCTFGTGSFILVNTGIKPIRSKHRLLTTVAWQLSGEKPVFALEGGAFVCGAAVQWLRDSLGIIQSSKDVETLAQSVFSSEGVTFVPALTGLGAPHWRSEARGIIAGLSRGTGRAHIARATLEAMAHQNADILDVMAKEMGQKLKSLHVDGGAVANNLLMQMQSNFAGIPVRRPTDIESTSRGAAWLAGVGIGLWRLESLKKLIHWQQEFPSELSPAQRKLLRLEWKRALAKAYK